MRIVAVSLAMEDNQTLIEYAPIPGISIACLMADEPSLVTVLNELCQELKQDTNSGNVDDHEAAPNETIGLVGVALGHPGGLSWLRRISAWWISQQKLPPQIMVSDIRVSNLDQLTVDIIQQAQWLPVHPREIALTSAAWNDPPPARYHVLVCCGVRCAAKGGFDIVDALSKAAQQDRENTMLVTRTTCLYPCNHAPVIVVYPDARWLGPVDEDDINNLLVALGLDEAISE